MDYWIDFEFNGKDGVPISLSLIREDNVAVYLGFKDSIYVGFDPWVVANVIPHLNAAPIPIRWRRDNEIRQDLEAFFKGDTLPHIIADWPDDIAYFCKLVLRNEPGTMINVPGFKFTVIRIDAYPTEVTPAVQHCSYWDAVALKQKYQFPNGMPVVSEEVSVNYFKFNPFSGAPLNAESRSTYEDFREMNLQIVWLYNPFTGAKRDFDDTVLDPLGLNIKE